MTLPKLNTIKETFQTDKGPPVGLWMTSRLGGYDKRMADMRSKRYILLPEEDSPVFSETPLPYNKAH
jgi:hypothetical protein